MRICLSAPNTLAYPDGGHLWVFLNWALGFRSLGHEVIWLDVVDAGMSFNRIAGLLETLRARLQPFGLNNSITLCTPDGKPCPNNDDLPLRPLDEALSCEVLCDHRYNLPHNIVSGFKRSMLIDIDPGQFQTAVTMGTYQTAPHNAYFTVGEWIKFIEYERPAFPTLGRGWIYTPPPVALEYWPVVAADNGAAMTTVSSWYGPKEWMPDENGVYYDNSKRAAFQAYLDLPRQSSAPLEISTSINSYQPEIDRMQSYGWRIGDSADVAHPIDYRRYLQQSLGEFSCAKPSYVRMRTGWLSDRTACYLASGKPVVVQKTGRSDIFPDDRGMLRFSTPEEAARRLRAVVDDYDTHSRAARQIAEDVLDAKKVLTRVLECCV